MGGCGGVPIQPGWEGAQGGIAYGLTAAAGGWRVEQLDGQLSTLTPPSSGLLVGDSVQSIIQMHRARLHPVLQTNT